MSVCVCVCVYTFICIYTHTFFLSYYLPSWSIPRDWIWFPVLYSRTSLLIHSKYNSLHLPTTNSQFIPLLPLSPLTTINLFSMPRVCFCFVDIFTCAMFYIPHISDIWLFFSDFTWYETLVISTLLRMALFCFHGWIVSQCMYYVCTTSSFLFFFFGPSFLGLHPWHMEVPRRGVLSELLLLAYATDTATPDPSRVCDLHHSA